MEISNSSNSYQRNRAYNDLPYIPPKQDLETKAVLKKVNTANKALSELKGWSPHQANPYLLLQTLILREAKASSEIENIVTTNDELYQAYALPEAKGVSPAAKEVLHYKDAIWTGYCELDQRPLCINMFLDLFRKVKQRSDGIRSIPGTQLKNSFGDVVYTPPDNPGDILRLLSNLERYINAPEDDLDPLIRLALIHYQYECIHPFPDGNGRTGRIINVLYLVQEKLLVYPILYLSHYIIEHKHDYYLLLQGVTERQEWEPWILYILDAVESTAKDTLNLLKDIHSLRKHTEDEIMEKAPHFPAKELSQILFEQPYCKISFLVDRKIAKVQTAAKYLSTLSELGLLDRIKIGRDAYYINTPLFRLLSK